MPLSKPDEPAAGAAVNARAAAVALPAALRATAAVLALLFAGSAQTILERTRFQDLPPDYRPLILFALAGGLAVAAVYGRWQRWPGERAMSIALPSWSWLVACLPGVACLAVATAVSDLETPSSTTAEWWVPGVLWLLVVGVLHAVAMRSGRIRHVEGDWSGVQVAAALALLVVVSLAMRTAVGVIHLPNFIESDETFMFHVARDAFAEDPFKWLRVYWVGTPMLSLLPMRIAQLFDDSFWGARMGNVVVGTISVLATFAAGRRLIGNWPALLAALLLAAAHTHVHWSRTVQPYIQSPTLAALLLWALVGVWTGGSLLAWIATALLLGIGTLMYQGSLLFLPLFVLTVLGWAASVRPGWKAFAVSTAFIGLVAALLMGPIVRGALVDSFDTASRPSRLNIFNAENLQEMGSDRTSVFLRHARATLTMFNDGGDGFGNYGALRPLVDAVTGALVPIAVVLLVMRIATPLGWVCGLWWAGYLFVTVFLAYHQPSFHRIPTALVFIVLAVAVASTQLLAAIRDGFRLGAGSIGVGCLAIAGGALLSNADFYFRKFPSDRGMWHTMGLAWIECSYVNTHVVLEATALDGAEYVPPDNRARPLLCPGREEEIVRVTRLADLWEVDRFTDAEDVVLITAAQVARENPGHPRGYRVVRYIVDDRIRAPGKLALAVIELKKERTEGQQGQQRR